MNSVLTGLVLIVDDMPTNLDVICEALQDAGLEVAIATSGERALQQIEREIPDLVLLDITMPGIDGFETCRRLKANPFTRDIPIIFMTALSDMENKVKALNLGAVDYVTKPFQEQEVLGRVKTHLQLRRFTQKLEHEVAQKTLELQNSQLQIVQSEKMASLGNLVAGVAHEINNPLGFLNGSIDNIQEYVQDLLRHLELYQEYHPHPAIPVQDHAQEIEMEFLVEDLPQLLNSMKGAIDRIQSISTSLRTFSRADHEYKVPANLHEGLESTLLILKYRLKANEFRPAIQVIRDYADLPEIKCFPGQLNQVFMNILANAIDILNEGAQQASFAYLQANPQTITIQSALTQKHVEIRLSDNGNGMSDEVKNRIFDHLFTTKTVGKGTGLGLTIARQIVVEKHNGSLDVQSQLGKGTEFCIRLPLL
ncbi:hybrid sensor histidine kinase/response regulator [Aetokthonos hydrillicola Thurmond2011]|jgi:signal transduction histidine kinase|uniref:histidine kinase n=1 Tax=Aetokthonos hydrillicola Thurmond2011 TaxID=2712845 RepID=A0AAP5MC31_9CYAN|nr:response regulator [Aetokthonos hydrillicola]MBW4586408.1 hybrid sensor histidine kinase/response regulator [Aetokthonos hydrillicola CCALA 1050]MDR9899885.1 hybrid sensor histidine kinase/response regulator [Aetokthonos hydrillicola Thurmond2011]